MKQPSLFLPHGGGPCFFLNENGPVPPEWRSMGDFLANVIADLRERPRALLVVSGHWEEPGFTVHSGERPDLLYDYGGFPEHTYALRWDAPGAPDVAREAARLIERAGFRVGEEQNRGWDHGVFIPLKVAVPDADIPTAQLSLRRDLDPAAHIAAGRALAPLRDAGVLIVGSGMSFHNMRLRDGSVAGAADAFDEALTAAVTDPDPVARDARLAAWESLPHARLAHPREEHLLPLMVAAGAGGTDKGSHVFRDHVIGWTVSGYRFG
ncbi:DODA-type extradiol aromatic ring-opening family dioxygenase [Allosphingosinicella sp.]|uniref:DODA-type extradiol aromatic ring-opening family dioxygenase n=1 Tax=Allosphingosinicella sp. TaxID=2823234 RepID=UPI002FC25ECC